MSGRRMCSPVTSTVAHAAQNDPIRGGVMGFHGEAQAGRHELDDCLRGVHLQSSFGNDAPHAARA